jgi:hypothetical protein
MEFIRYLHISNFSISKGYFGGFSFDPRGPGVSLAGVDCAIQHSGSPCAHGTKFYKNVSSSPIRFIILSDAEFPAECRCLPTPTDDPCHFDLEWLDKEATKSFIQRVTRQDISRVRFCAADGSVGIGSLELFVSLRQEFDQWKRTLRN